MSGMSFRRPARSRTQMLSHPKPLKKRRKPLEKPPWDDTTKDLSVFKLSNKELQRKHELHKPKRDHERLMRKIYESRLVLMADGMSFNTTSMTNQNETGISENEDSVLEVYERIYKGLPQVTKAPNSNSVRSFIDDLDEYNMSRYDVLSKSVVKQPELNYCSEESVGEYNHEEEADHKNENFPSGFQPNMDLNRYKQILDESYSMVQQDQKDDEKRRRILQVSDKQNTRHRRLESTSGKDVSDEKKKVTGKDKGSKCSKERSTNDGSLKTFDDMKQVLNTLEEEINKYEDECGRSEETNLSDKEDYSSCGGYTIRLLSNLTRLTKHLKESERQLRSEMAMRKEILWAFEEQKSMIDALTTDLFDTQEENKSLRDEIEEMKKQIQTQNAYLKTEIKALHLKLGIT